MKILQASRSPGVVGESSSRRADSALRIRSARMQTLRKRNSGDRLRGELPTGCGAGKVLRAGHETREWAWRLCEELGVVSATDSP